MKLQRTKFAEAIRTAKTSLKIALDMASEDGFKFFQRFLSLIFNHLSPPKASFDLKIFGFHTNIHFIDLVDLFYLKYLKRTM